MRRNPHLSNLGDAARGRNADDVSLDRWSDSAGVPLSALASFSLLFPIFLSGVGVRFSGFGFGVLSSLFFLRQ